MVLLSRYKALEKENIGLENRQKQKQICVNFARICFRQLLVLDIFPFTVDIHSGVSSHDETVVLMSKVNWKSVEIVSKRMEKAGELWLDKQSEKDFNKPKYKRLINLLQSKFCIKQTFKKMTLVSWYFLHIYKKIYYFLRNLYRN